MATCLFPSSLTLGDLVGMCTRAEVNNVVLWLLVALGIKTLMRISTLEGRQSPATWF